MLHEFRAQPLPKRWNQKQKVYILLHLRGTIDRGRGKGGVEKQGVT